MRYQGTHAEQILAAAGALKQRGVPFRRRDVRDELGLTQAEWMRSYVATFQGIREDRPSNNLPFAQNEVRGGSRLGGWRTDLP